MLSRKANENRRQFHSSRLEGSPQGAPVQPRVFLHEPWERGTAMSVVTSIVGKFSMAGELLQFFWQNKWWWLAPMIVLLLAFGILIIFAESSAIAPFIYTLF